MNRGRRDIFFIFAFAALLFCNLSYAGNFHKLLRARQDTIPAPKDTLVVIDVDTTDWFWQIDTNRTLSYLDSSFTAYFDSLSRDLPDAKDIKRAERKNRKDFRDSVRIATPRLLATFAISDSLYYRRLLMWTHERNFNTLELKDLDTTANYHFNDYPFFKKDVNATYLGVVGSATQSYNYFKREKMDVFPMFEPYLDYSYTPENMPQYNTKSAYTELAYWGTLFSVKAKEESEIKILTTQNITPALNFSLMYQRFGSKGMLVNENTDNRTFIVGLNYLGKKYLMNAGFINQIVNRTENGGIQDSFWIRDTTIDAKTIDVNLSNASNSLKRQTFYITHSLSIPMNFFRKDADSLALGEGTMAFIGHSGEYTKYHKTYSDEIGAKDTYGRDFYFNQFNINSTNSYDSLGVTRFENKAFLTLQPFDVDAIVSKISGGIGYQILSLYSFDPSYYISGQKHEVQHNAYFYAGASGRFKKYFEWDADGKYNFAGYNLNDFAINGRVKFSVYPIDEGIHLTGKFHTSLKEPHRFVQTLYSNHHVWNNNFGKTSETRIEGTLDIPKWKLQAFFGYALVSNMIYYDTLSVVRQHTAPISVMSAYLEKNFKVWWLHFDNRVLFQLSSNQDVLPLPSLSFNLRYYLQFDVVKEVMNMQVGLNAQYNTKYYAQSYSPDLGVFYNQNKELIGNTPYFDAFVNVQWKRACIFVKYTNTFINWPTSDYFSAYHYIKPQHGFKFGIFWPFYIH